MSRKNKYLRAFLHQNKNPTIEGAWNTAWKHAQKTFHSRSMQDMEARIDRLESALRDCSNELSEEIEGKYHGILGYPSTDRDYRTDMAVVEQARALLATNNQNAVRGWESGNE
jgi:hypothetical protein